MSSIADLGRRMSLAIERGTPMRLSAEDRDMLESCGALDVLLSFQMPELPLVCSHCAPRIYFIQAGEAGPIKIGIAKNVAARRTAHQTSNHEQLHVRADIPGTIVTEAYLHHFYAREHRRGEWFDPSPRLLAFIEQIGGRHGSA
jgi:hypothetical protein